jgi:phage terminase small subunit
MVQKTLTAKQAHFVSEYMVDHNATRAAEAAGYKNPMMSGSRLLNKRYYPLVAEAVAERERELSERLDVSAERVLKEYAKVGFFNPKRLMRPDGSMKDLMELPDDVAAAISSIDVSWTEAPDEEGVFRKVKRVELKFHSKLAALDAMAKHLGLFKDTTLVNQTLVMINWDDMCGKGPGPGPDETAVTPDGRRINPIELKMIESLRRGENEAAGQPPSAEERDAPAERVYPTNGLRELNGDGHNNGHPGEGADGEEETDE